MKFLETGIDGVVIVDLDHQTDERGFFARAYSADEFAKRGLLRDPVQVNVSQSRSVATLRGLHFQVAPHPDPKLVRCSRGSIYDVAVDLRRDSPTYCQWVGVSLTDLNRRALHIPAGCAHGFVTLEADTEVLYVMGESYHPGLARGVRWDDSAFAIEWPVEPAVVSDRDSSFPDYLP